MLNQPDPKQKTEFFPIELLSNEEIEILFGLQPDYCREDKIEHNLERMHAYG